MSSMSTGSVRDWRGLKHQLSHYSIAELGGVLAHATRTDQRIRRFIELVEAELSERGEAPTPPFSVGHHYQVHDLDPESHEGAQVDDSTRSSPSHQLA
jgi:hypothetical protein